MITIGHWSLWLLCPKNPISTENSKTNGQHKNATKNFDCTAIADRLRTVSWSNNSYPTCVVKPIEEQFRYMYIDNTVKYNRESTVGCSKCIVRDNNKSICQNKLNILKSQIRRDQVSRGVSVPLNNFILA